MQIDVYAALLHELRLGKKAVIATAFEGERGGAQGINKRLLTDAQGEARAAEAIERGIPLVDRHEGGATLYEPFFPEERLIVLGGGHIAVPLVRFASAVGFSVTVVDDRPMFANKPRFPEAKNVVCDGFQKAITDLGITPSDYVVIITRGHQHDQTCLQQLFCGDEPFYTGMIGSKRRIRGVKDALVAQGYDTGRLARLHSPIGLHIGGITPEEIALSIAAELVACKRLQHSPSSREQNNARSDIDFLLLETLAAESDAKAVATVVEAVGSVPRGAGAKMLIYPDGRTLGSIGGGCSESDIVVRARDIIGTGGYSLEMVDLTGDAALEEGMVCGGVMHVLIEDFC
jgi:xanthine dehydrogenase accessory factor